MDDKVDAVAVEAIELIPERVATTESVEKVRKTEIVVDKGSNELIQNKNCDAAANLEDTLERKEKEVVVEKAVDEKIRLQNQNQNMSDLPLKMCMSLLSLKIQTQVKLQRLK